MSRARRASSVFLLGCLPLLVGGVAACTSEPGDDLDPSEEAYTSATARLLDVTFAGEVLTSGGGAPEQVIRDQMLFTIGQMNGKVGVGRLDKLSLSDVKTTREGSLVKITYKATLPISIAKNTRVGRTLDLLLPKRADAIGQQELFTKYERTACTDYGAHDNEPGIYWYYWRPEQQGCTLGDEVVRLRASVKKSAETSSGKYPEYDKIWSDDTLRVVAIFGKVEDGTTTESDRGIWSHNHFVTTMRAELPNAKVTPAATPERPGIQFPDVTIESTLPSGKKVVLTSFLVDNVREGGAAFERRYNELSGDADVIVYNGHAGLGQNVRALARMGTFQPGKYQLVYMNGCDTFAYVDGHLAEARAALNPDDPKGTKYMEILTNSMPPTWDSLPLNTMSLVRDLAKPEAPVTYETLLSHFDQSGFVAVTGEEDNTYEP